MHPRSRAALAFTVTLAAALLAAAVQLQAARERWYPSAVQTEQSLYVRSGTALRRLTGAYNALFADVYWIRTLQYYGGTKLGLDRAKAQAPPGTTTATPDGGGYPLLYPLLDITTTLDPRFNMAYRFGSVYLAELYPRGAGRSDLALALLQKGLRVQPDKWQYMQDIGFVYYWWVHDFKTAASWFEKASQAPGGPWFLRSMAANTLTQGGDRQSSREMWQAIRDSAEIDWLRTDAERRLTQLQALDAIDQLQRVVDDYARRSGAAPDDWQGLVRARVLRGVPLDPTRVPFTLSSGRVGLSKSSTLWPLPEEPAHVERPPS